MGTTTTLDFDVETGDATADFAVFCLARPDGTRKHDSVESGLEYRAANGKFTGKLDCGP